MKKLFIFLAVAFHFQLQAQDLPVGFTNEEWDALMHGQYLVEHNGSRGIATPPPNSNIRCMAEWEEIQCLTIAWISYPTILKQIVANAKTQTRVIILSEDVAATEAYLLANNAGGPALANLDNVTILDASFDSVWMRDYAANPAYGNEVDSLVLVDWIYNRPTRPNDDASPEYIATELGIPLYEMTVAPEDLVNTGGNWMSDGFGTAFASNLILEENAVGNPYGVTAKSEAAIDGIVNDYLGIDRYIKMPTLPYDGIHHIDMHMKLLDEETLLVGEYPEGISDGPQINANIEYILSNFQSKWNTPYRVIRIPMPNSTGGNWPSNGASYRTYTNAVFVNKMVILPLYRTQYDTTALRIWNEALPGFEIVGIDCDNSTDNIIAASGAIHCITHSVGVEDPLLISHQSLTDTDNTVDPYSVVAYMNHRSGISQAKLYWKTTLTGAYSEVSMVSMGGNNWQGFIPAQPAGTRIYYYVEGIANAGKVQVRPMAAPQGYWHFDVVDQLVNTNELVLLETKVFPNPASALTCLRLQSSYNTQAQIKLMDVMGREVLVLWNGDIAIGEKQIFFDVTDIPSGSYHIVITHQGGIQHQNLIVR
jgi:agmatine/peptidylarginine deiminase